MSSWRDRLCGSVALGNGDEEIQESLKQFSNPNDSISCGGGFFPAHRNMANLKTMSNNFVLPTKRYSVLVFRDDGSAVIYSDVEPKYSLEEQDIDNMLKPTKV